MKWDPNDEGWACEDQGREEGSEQKAHVQRSQDWAEQWEGVWGFLAEGRAGE